MAISVVEAPAPQSFTKNPMIVVLQTDLTPLSEVRIDLRITVGTEVFYLSELPDVDSRVQFDISAALDEMMDNEYEHPYENSNNNINSTTGIFPVTKSPLEVLLDYFEYQDGVQNSTGLVNNF